MARPLTANLKHLYQYRLMWIFHLVLVIAISSLFGQLMATSAPEFPFVVSLMFFGMYGEMIAITILGPSNKPFAFCLPGHSREIKKMLFAIWLTITIVCFIILSMLYLSGTHIDPLLFIAFMGLMSLSFWSGTTVYIRKLQFLLFFIAIMVFSIILSENLGTTILHFITQYPLIIAFTSCLLSYFLYRATGSRMNHRRLCALAGAGLSSSKKSIQIRFNQERPCRYQNISFGKITESLGSFFIGQIKSSHRSGLIPYLWGQVSLIITPVIGRWKLLWLSFLGVYVAFIAFPRLLVRLKGSELYLFDMIVLILCSLLFSILCTHSRFKNFLLSGRTVHFFQGIVITLIAILLNIIFLFASVLLFHLLPIISPKILLTGEPLTIVIIPSIFLVLAPFIMVPLFGTLFILFRSTLLVFTLGVAAIFAIFVSFSAIITIEKAPSTLNPLSILFAAAIPWGFHLAALHYTSMKRSLY